MKSSNLKTGVVQPPETSCIKYTSDNVQEN
jgi:hypothetical protein